jgi:hypothetical protein
MILMQVNVKLRAPRKALVGIGRMGVDLRSSLATLTRGKVFPDFITLAKLSEELKS